MNFFSRLFRGNKSAEGQTVNQVHDFIRVTTPQIDEMFQVDPTDAVLPESVLEDASFLHFITKKGRRCAVNLKRVQTLQRVKLTGGIESTFPIRGIYLHLEGRNDSMDVDPKNADQFSNFFDALNSNQSFVKLGDYSIRKDEIVIAVASERLLDEWVWLG